MFRNGEPWLLYVYIHMYVRMRVYVCVENMSAYLLSFY